MAPQNKDHSTTDAIRDLLADIAPHAYLVDVVCLGVQVAVIVESLGGAERTLYISTITLCEFWAEGLTGQVLTALRSDQATEWIMLEAVL